MNRLLIFTLLLALSVAAPQAAAQDTIYTWIDENGVVRYTNTLPPEGAQIIDTKKEIPHDAEQARQREVEQRRFLEELEEQEQPRPEEAADRGMEREKAAEAAEAEEKSEAEEVRNRRNRRNETYHQDRIERRRAKELRQKGFQATPSN